jgi:hypothetical protein
VPTVVLPEPATPITTMTVIAPPTPCSPRQGSATAWPREPPPFPAGARGGFLTP